MAKIYANLYQKGKKTKEQIPKELHKEVEIILAERGIEFK